MDLQDLIKNESFHLFLFQNYGLEDGGTLLKLLKDKNCANSSNNKIKQDKIQSFDGMTWNDIYLKLKEDYPEKNIPKAIPVGQSENLQGYKNGDYIALYRCEPPEHIKKKKHGFWFCICQVCGKEFKILRAPSLKDGNKYKCSNFCGQSSGEYLISSILNNLNIKYIQEYGITNCINPDTNYQLRFDFYLPDHNCCIEYDGEQHFKEWGLGKNKDSLEKRKKRDNIKNQYCKDNNIYLIRIPYTDYNIITKEYILERLNNLEKYNYN